MSARDSSAGLTVSSRRFRDARGIDWARLEEMLDEIERGKASSLSDEDLFELPVLYRATLSSLSVARETSLDADLVAYLESLSTRAYFILYGVHAPFLRRVAGFFAHDWPAAVREVWRETGVAVVMMLVGAVSAYLLVRSDPSWYYAIIGEGLAQGRDPTASAQTLRESLYGSGDGLSVFASMLFAHNASVAIVCFALGFAFGVPTLLTLLQTGCMMGAFFAVFVPKGLGLQFAAWLAIHGTTELFAIALAGAAGLRIGMAIAFPGRRTRFASAVAAGRTSGMVMLGVIVMLAVAGMLEGIGRQIVTSDWLRVAIGGGALLGWLVYFYFAPLRAGAPRD
ncbi:MAG: stage II sporulation protein M [Pseudomonadota bacterium]